MKRKIFSVLLALALVLSLSLVMAGPMSTSTLASSSTWYVVEGGAGNQTGEDLANAFASIQDAIDEAEPGDTIMVAAGTYEEDLVIPTGKDGLELKGAGKTVTTIQGVSVESWNQWPLATPNIEILSNEVKISGFTIKSPAVAANSYSSGIVLTGTDIEIFNNAFVFVGHNTSRSVGIQTYSVDVLTTSDITGLKIYDNTFSSSGNLMYYVGIFVNRDSKDGLVTVSGNTFTGNIAQGIANEGSNAVIRGNTLTNSYTGTYASSGIAVMDWDASRAQADVTVTGNTLQGFARGIIIGHSAGTQPLEDVSVTNNVVESNKTGILVRSSAEGVFVNFNNIVDNAEKGVVNTVNAETLDARKNWWGTRNEEAIADMVEGDVDYEPWLGAAVASIKTGTVTNGILDAKNEADTEVLVYGTAKVTVIRYAGNPGGDPPMDLPPSTMYYLLYGPISLIPLGNYIDGYIPDTNDATEIEIRRYYTAAEVAALGISEESLRLHWWDGTKWIKCSAGGINISKTKGYSGYMWAKITEDTTPSLAQLTGTPFGCYGYWLLPTPCFIATAAYGTPTAEQLDVLREFRDVVLLKSIAGSQFVALYYQLSPPVADFISGSTFLRTLVREFLIEPVVWIVEATGTIWRN